MGRNKWKRRGATVKRASLMSTNKRSVKKSGLVEVGDEDNATVGFTERVLMSMVVDISQLAENVERVKVQVFTLAREHGVVPPASGK